MTCVSASDERSPVAFRTGHICHDNAYGRRDYLNELRLRYSHSALGKAHCSYACTFMAAHLGVAFLQNIRGMKQQAHCTDVGHNGKGWPSYCGDVGDLEWACEVCMVW